MSGTGGGPDSNVQHNVVRPETYPDLQAAKPNPALGDITLYENIGNSWYNALLLKWEKRFSQGLSYMASYSFSKHIGELMIFGRLRLPLRLPDMIEDGAAWIGRTYWQSIRSTSFPSAKAGSI